MVIILIFAFVLILILLARRAASGGSRSISAVDYVLHGASIIDDDFGYYPDWSAMMLREFDDSVEPYLERWFEAASLVAKHPREEWQSAAEDALRNLPRQE